MYLIKNACLSLVVYDHEYTIVPSIRTFAGMKIIGVCSLLAGLAAVTACASDDGPDVDSTPDTAAEYNTDLDYAQVEFVEAVEERSAGSDVTVWRFSVRVRHRDQGWDHYADAWEVIDHKTEHVYGTRELAHPHDNEQPFTRSRRGIEIPASVTLVRVRATCNVHGFGGREIVVDLSADTTDADAQRRDPPDRDYTVNRL